MFVTTLNAGVHIILAGEMDEGDRSFHLDPAATFCDDEEERTVAIVRDEVRTGGIDVDGIVGTIIRLEEALPSDYDQPTINTTCGPIVRSDLYLILPATDPRTNPNPADQYAYNWLVLEVDRPTDVDIEGGTLVVGDRRIVLDAGPDIEVGDGTVIRYGTPEMAALGPLDLVSDGVFAVFAVSDQTLPTLRSIDSDEARAMLTDDMIGTGGDAARIHVDVIR